MANKRKQYDLEFKKAAIKYISEHPDMTHDECALNLGVGSSTLAKWKRQFKENDGVMPFRGSGNYSSDIEKENVRLKRELKNTKDALEILKKAISILGE